MESEMNEQLELDLQHQTDNDGQQDTRTPSPFVPQLGLFRKIGGRVMEVNLGDTVVLTNGKRFYVTGWDEVQGYVHGTSMCPHKYFVSIPVDMFGCYFAEV